MIKEQLNKLKENWLLLVLFLVVLFFVSGTSGSTFSVGELSSPSSLYDLDGDGSVDLSDLSNFIANILFTGNYKQSYSSSEDYDGDGDLDWEDIKLLLNEVYGTSP